MFDRYLKTTVVLALNACLCNTLWAGTDQLNLLGISGITTLQPNSNTTGIDGPGGVGHLAAKVAGQNEGELLVRYGDLLTWAGFPGGVTVHNVTISLLVYNTPSPIALSECTGATITNDKTWNNYPGPSSKGPLFGTIVASGPGEVTRRFFPLTARIQSLINAGQDRIQLVYYGQSFGSYLTRVRVPIIVVEAYLNGDTDKDNDVDFADFLTLQQNYGGSGGWAQGDFNGNGIVDFADYLQLSQNFGEVLND